MVFFFILNIVLLSENRINSVGIKRILFLWVWWISVRILLLMVFVCIIMLNVLLIISINMMMLMVVLYFDFEVNFLNGKFIRFGCLLFVVNSCMWWYLGLFVLLVRMWNECGFMILCVFVWLLIWYCIFWLLNIFIGIIQVVRLVKIVIKKIIINVLGIVYFFVGLDLVIVDIV